jgi:hypothetical protein
MSNDKIKVVVIEGWTKDCAELQKCLHNLDAVSTFLKTSSPNEIALKIDESSWFFSLIFQNLYCNFNYLYISLLIRFG